VLGVRNEMTGRCYIGLVVCGAGAAAAARTCLFFITVLVMRHLCIIKSKKQIVTVNQNRRKASKLM
jgi:hypothetical protein